MLSMRTLVFGTCLLAIGCRIPLACEATRSDALMRRPHSLPRGGNSDNDGGIDVMEDDDWTHLREKATILRSQGKELHDEGDFAHASSIFHQASQTLEPIIHQMQDASDQMEITQEYTTCLLHQTLCALKDGQHEECIAACTKLLQDGVVEEGDDGDNDNDIDVDEDDDSSMNGNEDEADEAVGDEDNDDDGDEGELDESAEADDNAADNADIDVDVDVDVDDGDKEESEVTVEDLINAMPSAASVPTTSKQQQKVPSIPVAPPVRARAYHRRAKAKLAIGDDEGALADARSAAFLGDSKGVALYGKLMRDSSSSDLFSPDGMTSPFGSMFGSLGSQPSSSDPSNALLESLLNKSPLLSGSSDASSNSSPLSSLLTGDFNPTSLLLGGLGGGNKKAGKNKKNDASLAKSVLKSVSKRLEDDATQDTICKFLHNTNEGQFKQWSSMAGMQLSDNHISQVTNICHNITPKTIKRTVRTTKGAVYVVQFFRKVGRILHKYRSVLFAIVLLQWGKSAVLRPVPVRHSAMMGKQQMNNALKANKRK